MNSVRRLVLVSVLVLAMALTSSAALAGNTDVNGPRVAQTGSTPLEICEAATQEIVERRRAPLTRRKMCWSMAQIIGRSCARWKGLSTWICSRIARRRR